MMIRILLAGVIIFSGILRGEDGSAVVVLYNSAVPASKEVADHYAQKRSVPAAQIIGLPMPGKEAISRDEYNKQIAEPFLKKLEDSKIWEFKTGPQTNASGQTTEIKMVANSKIRYAVLCFGVPVKIVPDNNLKEAGTEQLRPEVRRNEAAVDNELATLPLFYANLPLSGPLLNRLFANTNATILHPTKGLLIVTRLDGPTPEIAKGLVDKAIQAERDGLWGRAYFDSRSMTNSYKAGDDMIVSAEKQAASFGFETTLDKEAAVFSATFPMSHIALYIGWYEDNVAGAMARPKVEFMPGAFAYHLHSYSAQTIRDPNLRWVGPLLAKGAAATMGSTDEPYLEGTPDVSVFLWRWLFMGYSFGEAAYSSQKHLSWQTTVVGDPLYRPFVKPHKQQHEELLAKKSKMIEWSFLRVVNAAMAGSPPISPDDAITFLRRETPQSKESAVLQEKIGDIYKSRGRLLDAMDPYEQALKLNPSPQQRMRISLNLAPLQMNLGRGRQAYQIYQGLLRDYPDYPDRKSIFEKILPLAKQFGKPEEAAEYEKGLKDLTPAAVPPPQKQI